MARVGQVLEHVISALKFVGWDLFRNVMVVKGDAWFILRFRIADLIDDDCLCVPLGYLVVGNNSGLIDSTIYTLQHNLS